MPVLPCVMIAAGNTNKRITYCHVTVRSAGAFEPSYPQSAGVLWPKPPWHWQLTRLTRHLILMYKQRGGPPRTKTQRLRAGTSGPP